MKGPPELDADAVALPADWACCCEDGRLRAQHAVSDSVKI